MSAISPAFYVVDGDSYLSTEHTRGPWGEGLQHAGPPSALLARAIEAAADGLQVVRLGIDLLKPVPIVPLRIRVDERTGGKRRRVLEAVLCRADDGLELARATAQLLRREAVETGELPLHDPEPPIGPDEAEAVDFGFFTGELGYHTAMELRCAAGGIGTGRTQMWMRPRVALVDGEAMSPLQRLMTVADSGNGVSLVLDIREFAFTNPDLTVNIRREPRGDWLCLDARTHFQPHGLGMAESRIWDADGVCANGTQNLLLQRRTA